MRKTRISVFGKILYKRIFDLIFFVRFNYLLIISSLFVHIILLIFYLNRREKKRKVDRFFHNIAQVILIHLGTPHIIQDIRNNKTDSSSLLERRQFFISAKSLILFNPVLYEEYIPDDA